MLREPVFCFLGEDQFVVGHDLENAAPGLDQFRFHSQLFLNGLCQTGSLGIVVSLITVFDGDFPGHNFPLSFMRNFGVF